MKKETLYIKPNPYNQKFLHELNNKEGLVKVSKTPKEGYTPVVFSDTKIRQNKQSTAKL